MKKGEFIRISKRMVKEYVNRYIDETKHISQYDVSVMAFSENKNAYRILLTTPASEDLYYGVTYEKDTDKLYSYTYKKLENRVRGKKNKNSRHGFVEFKGKKCYFA